jgi:hypothetical protein
MAVAMNHVSANTIASSTAANIGRSVRGSSAPAAGTDPGGACSNRRGRFGSVAFNGSPSTTCNAAHARQAPRHPSCASSSVVSGQPIVLANPAMSVMPVITLRARWRYR